MLELVQLGGLSGRYPTQLPEASASAWRSLVRSRSRPRFLLLDEPFGRLDARCAQGPGRSGCAASRRGPGDDDLGHSRPGEADGVTPEQIVVMNDGRVEQTASRATSTSTMRRIVMSFEGPATGGED